MPDLWASIHAERARLDGPAEMAAFVARQGGHYTLRIASPAFAGKRPVQCHRLIYAALGELMQTDIHALAIELLPDS